MSKLQTSANQVTVRKNSGADVGTRPRLNFIEGTNVTLTVADDAGSNEVDITVTSAGGGGGGACGWLNQFFPAVDPNAFKGTYAAVQMSDAVTTDIYQTFMIPSDIATITQAVILVIPNATGNLYWECSTNFAEVCSNEDCQTHIDSITANTDAMTANELMCIDISTSLTNALGGDVVGINFTRLGASASDTVGDSVYYVGILIGGTV